jgi:hypothetical protein
MRPPLLRHSIARLLMPARNSIGLCKQCDAAVAGVRRAPLGRVTRSARKATVIYTTAGPPPRR